MNHMRGSFHGENKLREAVDYQASDWVVYEDTDPRLGVIARADGKDSWVNHIQEILHRVQDGQTFFHVPSRRQISKADCLFYLQLEVLEQRAIGILPQEDSDESLKDLAQAAPAMA
jgi:hypothetical protein